jgi:raffinose/stachyose/melibiose transport system permease protein
VFFRFLYFLPHLTSALVVTLLWKLMFDPTENGILNQILASLGMERHLWLQDPSWAMLCCILPGVWAGAGMASLIYIAALSSLPQDYYEAAAIDGANAWQTFWKVKLPMIMSSITVCVFLTLTNSFKLFDQNLALTAGDPAHSTEMLALNIYQTFYSRAGMQWKGYGQAKAVLFCILVVVISFAQLRATRSKEVQR